MDPARTLTVEEVEELQRENGRMRRALERIVDRTQRDELDLPDARSVPRALAAGMLLAVQGLAEAALE
jgi:hypothetical protein